MVKNIFPFQVIKKSGKPFKSGSTVATVTGVITHPITGRQAYTLLEDGTYVEVIRCLEYIKEESVA